MKKKSLKILAITCIVFSLAFNLLVLFIDVIPYFSSLFKRKMEKDVPVTESVIVNESLDMALSDKVVMVWDDPGSFSETVIKKVRYNNTEHRKYNYPKAFLFYGLSAYLIQHDSVRSLGVLKEAFDKLIDDRGNPVFQLDKTDQVPYGLTALNLYGYYKEDRYLSFANVLFDYINRNMDDTYGVVLYRNGASCQLNDVIGMIVPFLVEYYKVTTNKDALSLAAKQLDFFIRYGVDKDTYMPAHGIELAGKIKTGSINWGRGIGWYLLGLVYLNEAMPGAYNREYDGIVESLDKLKDKEGVWSQFPGSSTEYDASSTTMFLLGLSYSTPYTKKEIIDRIKTGADGRVLSTSGDTYNLNKYSSSFGDSELSQGILLLLLSRLNK